MKGIVRKLMVLAIVPLLAALASCARHAEDAPEEAGTVLFRIRIALSGNDSFASPAMVPLSRAGEELPASDIEKLNTLRIIILDGEGKVEVNEIWDLRSAPATIVTGNHRHRRTLQG